VPTTCLEIFELSDGSFAVIGTDRTEELEGALPRMRPERRANVSW
jgi:hypothetical protein